MTPEIPQNYYFTFGSNTSYHNKYVKIQGTHQSTRIEMFNRFGDNWAFQYNEVDFLPQIKLHNLTELK